MMVLKVSKREKPNYSVRNIYKYNSYQVRKIPTHVGYTQCEFHDEYGTSPRMWGIL